MFESVQSTLDPAGSGVVWMGELAWAAMFGGTLVIAIIMLLAICGVGLAPRSALARRWALRGGMAFPALALAAVLGYALVIGEAFSRDAPARPMRAELVAKPSWSEVRYEPLRTKVVARELRVPFGRSLELLLPDGTPLRVTAVSPAEFDEWLAREAAPSVTPTNRALQAGRAAFFRARCDDCHRIRGTAAHGSAGPDLTHVGARLEPSSAVLGAHVRAAARFGAGTRAAPIDIDGELRALGAYLASLK